MSTSNLVTVRFVPAVLTLTSLLFGACAQTPLPPRELTSICPKHRVPLESVKVFRVPKGVMIDPSEAYVRYAARYPYHRPFGYSPKMDENFTIPETIRVCPRCDQDLKRKIDETYN